jgi:hypothetical protein
MIGRFVRAALIFVVAVLLDIILRGIGEPMMNDVADPSNLPNSAPPLVQWGNLAIDWFLAAVLFSLLVYMIVGAWIENQATGGL